MELALGSAKELSFEKQTQIISATVLQGSPLLSSGLATAGGRDF